MPARRAETALRARQGSPVAKRRARIHLMDRRGQQERGQHRQKDVQVAKRQRNAEKHGSGEAAAERGAEGDGLREGEPVRRRERN